MRKDGKFVFRWLICVKRISWKSGFMIVFTANSLAPALNNTIPVHSITHISSKYIFMSLSNWLLELQNDPFSFYCPNFSSSKTKALSGKRNKRTLKHTSYKRGPEASKQIHSPVKRSTLQKKKKTDLDWASKLEACYWNTATEFAECERSAMSFVSSPCLASPEQAG